MLKYLRLPVKAMGGKKKEPTEKQGYFIFLGSYARILLLKLQYNYLICQANFTNVFHFLLLTAIKSIIFNVNPHLSMLFKKIVVN